MIKKFSFVFLVFVFVFFATSFVSVTKTAAIGLPACSDFVDNDGDEMTDDMDPQCHTDGNGENPSSYDPLIDSEGVVVPVVVGLPVCSDFIDNDGDELIDDMDPACHTDGDASNPSSYDPLRTKEVLVAPVVNAGLDSTSAFNNEAGVVASNASASDADGSIVSYVWTLVSGPVDAVISSPNTLATDFTNLAPGVYVFKLTVTDNDGVSAEDTVTLTVSPIVGGGSVGGSVNPASVVNPAPTNNPVVEQTPTPATGEVLGATTESTEACGIYITKFLRRGYANDKQAVMKLQKFLNDKEGEKLTVDGVYGIETENAVKRFQNKYKDDVLTPWGHKEATGIFYLTSQTKVNNIMCPDLKLSVPELVKFSTHPEAPRRVAVR